MKNLIRMSLMFWMISGVYLSSCKKEEVPSILENFSSLPVNPNSYWNGSDKSGGFTINGITFRNTYNSDWNSWSGFAYSNMHDVKTAGLLNQYSNYAMKDTGGNNTFVVAYPYLDDNTIVFDSPVYDVRLKVTNNTYAALAMKYGDEYSKKFGGADSLDNDWFKLTITGIGEDDLPTDSARIYLADFRFSGWENDYILDEWLPVNLSGLGRVKKLRFQLSSSDMDAYGMRTPGYFCLDDVEYKLVGKTL